jgi:2-polyprenyl-3-methyl-5-hydroxy-6-metoxy-1,4-benzoquinol methylase
MNSKEVVQKDGVKYKVNLSFSQQNDVRVMAANSIENNSKVLDVGCACGDFGALIAEHKNSTVYGMEYNEISLEEARKKAVFKCLHQIDLNKFETSQYGEYLEFFDYITLLDVLEHTTNPDESLLRLKPYIKKDGLFIVSLPNISFGGIKLNLLQDEFNYTDMGILDRTHLRFFTWKSIATFFAELGFEITSCQVKISDLESDLKGVPVCVEKFVKDNPHSYVYQYVVTSKISNLDGLTLKKINREKMTLQSTAVKTELKKIRKLNWISKLLPVGSKARVIAKWIKKLVNINYKS